MTPATEDNGQWLGLALDIGKWMAGGVLSLGIWFYLRLFPDKAWVMKQIGLSVERLRDDVAANRKLDKAETDDYRHALKADLDRLRDHVDKSLTEQTNRLIDVILKRRA